MKELSIEQKSKAYDKALERARNLHKDAIDMGDNSRAKQCEIIFPELRESKDDRIMRVIRGWIYTRPASFFDNGISKEVMLAWLEKQVEQKPILDVEIPFGAKDSELQEATYFIPKGFHAEIDDDKVVIKKGEKPAAWSKKDEKMFEYALNMIEWYSGKNEDKSRFVSDWLKCIKQRIGG